MGRQYATDGTMGNNHDKNKDFKNAARDAGLTKEETYIMNEILHKDKEFEAGDWTYAELLVLAEDIKNKKI